MANPYRKAIEKRESLRRLRTRFTAKLSKIDAELADLDAYCRVHEELEGIESTSLVEAPVAAPVKAEVQTAKHDKETKIQAVKESPVFGGKLKRIREYSRQLVSKHGVLNSSQALEKLDELGVGKDLILGDDRKKRLKYISSVMARDPDLKQDRERGGYVLKQEALI